MNETELKVYNEMNDAYLEEYECGYVDSFYDAYLSSSDETKGDTMNNMEYLSYTDIILLKSLIKREIAAGDTGHFTKVSQRGIKVTYQKLSNMEKKQATR